MLKLNEVYNVNGKHKRSNSPFKGFNAISLPLSFNKFNKVTKVVLNYYNVKYVFTSNVILIPK